jgi:hypothetical protein
MAGLAFLAGAAACGVLVALVGEEGMEALGAAGLVVVGAGPTVTSGVILVMVLAGTPALAMSPAAA